MPNILVYDTSCSTGEGGLPLEIVAFLAHGHPTTPSQVPLQDVYLRGPKLNYYTPGLGRTSPLYADSLTSCGLLWILC